MFPRRALAFAVVAVAWALSLASLAPTVSAAAAPAPVPTWTVGQSVGYGTHLDLGALIDTYLLKPIRQDPSAFNITSIQALNATGGFDLWEVDTVTDKTGTYYVLGQDAAQGTMLDVTVNVTVKVLPQAGTYNGTLDPVLGCIPPTVPTAPGTVAFHMNATSLSVTNGTTRYQVSNLAIMNESQNVALQAKVVTSAYHVPMIDLNTTTCKETVSYDSPSFTLSADTQNQVRVFYTPAYDFFNFTIHDNETWWARANATVGATLTGTIDAKGLTAQEQASFFNNLTKAFQGLGLVVSGLDHFPIDLAKLTVTAGLQNIINNGVVQDTTVPIAANYRAIGAVMSLSDNNQHPVYLITNASYQCPLPPGNLTLPLSYAAVYAPDFPAQGAGMIVGYEVVTCALNMNVPVFSLPNDTPADARANIGKTKSTYQTTPPTGTTSNALADFFLQAPYWGILIVVAAVAAGVAFVVLRRRRKPAAALPPPPPSEPGTP